MRHHFDLGGYLVWFALMAGQIYCIYVIIRAALKKEK
jgi:hypothetical protein